jgi:hypothetical protein
MGQAEQTVLLDVEIEKMLTEQLPRYGEFLTRLGLTAPYRWIAGLTGVKNRQLQFPRARDAIPGIASPVCASEHVISEGSYDGHQSPRSTFNQTFTDWTVLVVRFNSAVTFRAGTSSESNPPGLQSATFVISLAAGSCDQYTAELITIARNGNTQDYNNSPEMPIAARVDDKPILVGKIVRMAGNLGETDLHSYINFGDSSSQLISDLLGGHKLRLNVKLDNPPDNVYFRFGLNGATAGLQAANLTESQNTKSGI